MPDERIHKSINQIIDEKEAEFIYAVRYSLKDGPFARMQKASSDFSILKPLNDEYFQLKRIIDIFDFHIIVDVHQNSVSNP